jgi:hypothetical protein
MSKKLLNSDAQASMLETGLALVDRYDLEPLPEEDLLAIRLAEYKKDRLSALLVGGFMGLLMGVFPAALAASLQGSQYVVLSVWLLSGVSLPLISVFLASRDFNSDPFAVQQSDIDTIMDQCEKLPAIRPLFRKYIEARGAVENWNEDDCERWSRAAGLLKDDEDTKKNIAKTNAYLCE